MPIYLKVYDSNKVDMFEFCDCVNIYWIFLFSRAVISGKTFTITIETKGTHTGIVEGGNGEFWEDIHGHGLCLA